MVGRPKRAAAKAVKSYATDTNGQDDIVNSPSKKSGGISRVEGKGKSIKSKKRRGSSNDDSDMDEYRAPEEDADEDEDDEFEAAERTDDDDDDGEVEEPEGDLIDSDDVDGGGKSRKSGGGSKKAGYTSAKKRGMVNKGMLVSLPKVWSQSYVGPNDNDIGYFGNEKESLTKSVFPNVAPFPDDFKVDGSPEGLEGKVPLPSKFFSFKVEGEDVDLEGYRAHRITKDGTSSSAAYIVNTGLNIWAVDWAPLPEESQMFARSAGCMTDYVAVGGVPLNPGNDNTEPLVLHSTESYANIIQIWGVRCPSRNEGTDNSVQADDNGSGSRLEMCIRHSYGGVLDLKWCSIGGHLKASGRDNALDRLGILAASFSDGTIRFIVIPTPTSVRKHLGQENGQEPLHIEFDQPIATFNLQGVLALSIAWGTEKRFAAGGSDGRIYVWDTELLFGPYSREMNDHENADLLEPYFTVEAHTHGVRSIDWARTSDGRIPHHIISSGLEGRVIYTDVRDIGSVFTARVNTHVPYAVMFVPWFDGYVYPEPDKSARFEQATSVLPVNNFRVLALPGHIWSLSYSDFHPYFAAGSEGGATYYANPTFVAGRSFMTPQTRVFKGRIVKTLPAEENEDPHNDDESGFDRQTARAFETMEKEIADLETGGFKTSADDETDTELDGVDKGSDELYDMEGKDLIYAKHAELIAPDLMLFPPSIAVKRVQWSRNHHSASWLASGIANGLLRIDNCHVDPATMKKISSQPPRSGIKPSVRKLGRPRKDPSGFTQKEKKQQQKAAALAAKTAAMEARMRKSRETKEAREVKEAEEAAANGSGEKSTAAPQRASKLAPIFLASQRRSTRSMVEVEPVAEESSSTATAGRSSDQVAEPSSNNRVPMTGEDEMRMSVDNPEALSAEEQPKIVPMQPKRGRPRKSPATSAPSIAPRINESAEASTSATVEASVDTDDPTHTTSDPIPVSAPPKKRGRPPKNKNVETTQSDPKVQSPAQEGRGQQTLLSIQGPKPSLAESDKNPTVSPAGSRSASPAPSASGPKDPAAAIAVPPSPRKTRTSKMKDIVKSNRSLTDMWGVKSSK